MNNNAPGRHSFCGRYEHTVVENLIILDDIILTLDSSQLLRFAQQL